MTQKFAVGQKVKIKEGGWGFHPIHEGKIVTIHSITAGGRYTTEEALSDPAIHSIHFKRETSVDGRSFEAIEATHADQIRAINAQIREKQMGVDVAKLLVTTREREKETLVRERQVLIARMLKELDV